MVSCDFRRVTEIFDKMGVGPLEALKKGNVFWEQCLAINQVCHAYHEISEKEFWQVNDRWSLVISVLLTTTFSDFFDW